MSGPAAPTDTKTRVAWLDAAKGLGIILVVAGHSFNDPWIRSPIFLFHMPLFFLLSGYTMKGEAFGVSLAKRARSLLIPYVSFFVLVTLLDIAISQVFGTPMSLNWRDPPDALYQAIYGGQKLRASYAVFWFITCLFVAQLVLGALIARMPNALDWRWAVVMGLCAAASYLAYMASPSPWNAAMAPTAMLFLFGGYLWRQLGERQNWMLHIGIAAVAIGLAIVCEPLDLKYAKIGTPVLSLVAGFLLTYTFIRISQVLAQVPRLSEALVWLGQASLAVMFLHMLVIFHFHAKWGAAPTFVVACVVPLLIYPLLKAFGPTRTLLLGGR